MTTPLPELLLERYALDETTPEEKRAIEAALAESPEDRARLEALAASNRDILSRYPAATMADRIGARAEGSKTSWMPRLLVAGPAVAVAAVLLFTLVPDERTADTLVGTDSEVTRIKGLLPALFVHRQTAKGSERLGSGELATEHDVLQLSYLAAGRDHGAILSIDGRGTVTLHHPVGVDGDTALLPTGEAALPRAYELDDAPSFERFFLVTLPLASHSTFETRAVVDAAEQLARDPVRARTAPLPLPPEYEQTSVVVAKQEGSP